ncbi:hypothetical protein B0J13DRAFT_435115 [Dactylonectria estremocensis]|uniref:Protein kinase domain-containing protein n=1 Tax=Dactylonectria estremocensis TaxID=1079267 RepID=A0A9P9FB13_9HYPO|nr:hypothetical protein B0J13DRAFT_435115 [Dactylonectria estremocensis]
MPEQYSSYKLRTDVLESWLRHTFEDPTIVAEPRNGFFVFDLPGGQVLTDYYPTNNLRSGNLKRALNKHYNDLNANKDRLFDAEDGIVDFLEARDGETKYQQKSTESATELESHLLENRKDPKCRHIFLEYVHSFGLSELPKDYSMTGFFSEDSLAIAHDDVLKIPELGRSGRELRVSYLLRSVELTSEEDDENIGEKKWPWRVRQMAVYHSFDFVTGRALWLNLKANSLMKETITDAVAELPELKTSSLGSLPSKFEATLATHLIFADWCDSNWRSCINEFESDLCKVLIKGKTARITQKDESTAVRDTLKRKMSLRSQSTFQTRKEQRAQTSESVIRSIRANPGSLLSTVHRSLSKLTDQQDASLSKSTATQKPVTGPSESVEMLSEHMKDLQDLDTFSFGELQDLHHMGEQLHEMSLVIQLDAQALRDIREYYSSLMANNDVPKEIRDNCKSSVARFIWKVDRVAKNLEIRLTQLESMKTWLDDGKALFDGILQFKSLQINKILAEVAVDQSQRMQEIANKTEKETESMHIITFVTLAFLPGTFVATFFQSGLFQWKEDGHNMRDSLKFNWIAFSFFAAICFPLMAVIFGMWWLWLRRRNRVRPGAGEAYGHSQTHTMAFTRDYHMMIGAPVDEFAQYVTHNHLKGRQGDNPNAEFIPRSALVRYWTLDKLKSILLACQPPIYNAAQVIDGGFICVFSILVYIGYPAAIAQFTGKGLDDHRPPFAAVPPEEWPTHPQYEEIYNKFRKHQWAFAPLEFRNGAIHKRTIDPQTILPVEYEAELGRNSGANDVALIWKVKIHEDTVVFKVYHEAASDIFSSEADVYTLLPRDYERYIVKYHGSFKQADKNIIILEYAPGGSLLDLFERTRLPNPDEVKTLWKELFQLLIALYMMHEMEVPADCSTLVLSGTHHDIQPVNILVFTQDTNSEYNVYFKLADFGTARIIRTLSADADTQAGNNDGNRMYSELFLSSYTRELGELTTAPESCPIHPVQDEVPKKVNPTVDVWGLGAVFSETLIWSILGEDGRESYRKRRKEENQEHRWMKGSGYDACFHDGTKALEAVKSMHHEAVLQTRRIDTLSPKISEVILGHMLQPWEDRLDTMGTLTKAKRVLEQPGEEKTPTPTSHPSTPSSRNRNRSELEREVSETSRNSGDLSPIAQDNSTRVFPSLPLASPITMSDWSPGSSNQTSSRHSIHELKSGSALGVNVKPITCRDVYIMLIRKGSQLRHRFGVGSSSEALNVLGIHQALAQITAVGGREQLVLIDDFASMQLHKENVAETARVISYYVKRADPNDMELYFASDVSARYGCKNSTHVENIIRKHKFLDGECPMGQCLANILDHVWKTFKKSSNPVSIYVLTDGVWETEDDQIDHVIARSAMRLAEKDFSPQSIMIQFIRFGQSPVGYRRLKQLDDDLVQTYNLGA